MPNHEAQATILSLAENLLTADIESLVTTHYAYVHRLAISILNDPDEAEDAAQETFIAANRSLSSFRGQSEVKTWLTSIAVNACRGRLRKAKARQGLARTMQSLHLARRPQISTESLALQRESDRQLWQAVDDLDDKHRLVVILRYVHELSTAEIAAALEISQGTVHSRLFYARRQLHKWLSFLEEVADGAR
jgi:RNA polymerase sigma-70 factor (ECF subfamily)